MNMTGTPMPALQPARLRCPAAVTAGVVVRPPLPGTEGEPAAEEPGGWRFEGHSQGCRVQCCSVLTGAVAKCVVACGARRACGL